MFCLQITILSVVNFADLTIAMLLVHLFTFDRRWLSLLARGDSRQPQWPPRVPSELKIA